MFKDLVRLRSTDGGYSPHAYHLITHIRKIFDMIFINLVMRDALTD